MNKILINKRLTLALYILLVIFTIGMGMGVPLLTILLGAVVGWFLPEYLSLPAELGRDSLRALLRAAGLSSVISLVGLGVIWLPALSLLRDPAKDLTQFGMPLILYEPLASFIGWIVLMVLISPFMQFLMTLLGGMIRVAYFGKGEKERIDL